MKIEKTSVVALVVLWLVAGAFAQSKEKGLGIPGGQFGGTLIFDSKGNLYGTSNLGGLGAGSVWELSPLGNGKWQQITIDDTDLVFPNQGVTMDSAGNLYGADNAGPPPNFFIQGSIFELSPNGTGGWTKTLLYYFPSFAMPGGPNGDLLLDAQGNIYGTTIGNGNTFGPDAAFELQKTSRGYNYIQLYTFCTQQSSCPEGQYPESGLIADRAGNLYGTTMAGGTSNQGVIYELKKVSNGKYTYTVLHSFTGTEGTRPYGRLLRDASGNLYGTTFAGGANSLGNVFEYGTDGTLTSLYDFSGPDGQYPYCGVTMDSKGTIYSTTVEGGANNAGTVFKLVKSGGQWQETVLYSFPSKFQNELGPYTAVTLDSAGNLYGNTLLGQTYEVKP